MVLFILFLIWFSNEYRITTVCTMCSHLSAMEMKVLKFLLQNGMKLELVLSEAVVAQLLPPFEQCPWF